MNSRLPSIVIGTVTIAVALLLAWRLGLLLESPTDGVPDVPIHAPAAPPYAKGQAAPDLQFELRDVTFSGGGKRADGFGIVRYAIRREEIRPVAEAMLRTLKAKAPATEKIVLTLRPAVEWPAPDVAQVTWQAGTASIGYGIPTMTQIEEWNSGVGKTTDRIPLHLPDRETFSTGIAVIMAMDSLKKQKPEAKEEELLEAAAKQVNVPAAAAKRARTFIYTYYTGNRYGKEEFELQLP